MGVLLLIMALIGFIDYIIYNFVRYSWHLTLYRVAQIIIFLLVVGLFYYLGLYKHLFAFIILYFGWWCDLAYYIYYDLLKWYGGSYAGKAFKSEVLGNRVTWAWWTFIGLIHMLIYTKKVPISGFWLILQLILTMCISIFIMVN